MTQKKKKIIIIGIFVLLIIVTAGYFIKETVETYNYEMKNDDLLKGLGTAMCIMAGGFIIFYEFDLFYTVYYFFIKPKTKIKSILNIASNLSLLLIIVLSILSDGYIGISVYENGLLVLLSVYLVCRIICFMCCRRHKHLL